MKRKDTIDLTRVAFIGAAMVVFLIGLLLMIETGLDGEIALLNEVAASRGEATL